MSAPPDPKRSLYVLLAFLGACNGGITCGGCAGGNLDPIPGGFDPSAQIERAAQIRLTRAGLDFIQTEFQNLVQGYARMKCGANEPIACPTSFHNPGGTVRPTMCDPMRNICVDPTTMTPEPVLGFEIERAVNSGATVCRDDPAQPNPRRCFAWLRLEGLQLATTAPDDLKATITAQLYTSPIPFRYDNLGMDCLVTMDSSRMAPAQQDFLVDARVGAWMPPVAGTRGGQLEIAIDGVTAMIPDQDVNIARDPVHGDILDAALCGIANLGVVKNALIPRITGSLSDVIDKEVRKVLGWRCNGVGTQPCPAGTTCNGDNLCAERGGKVVPQRLGLEGRLSFDQVQPGLAGALDLSFLVGGMSALDTSGINLSLLGGAELGGAGASCVPRTPSPRSRMGWVPPDALPTADRVDLNFDGMPETPYMLAAGISKQLIEQALWGAFQSGIFCTSISSYETPLLNTGSLSVLVPSLQQLTHQDRFPWSVWPARVSIRPRAEPRVTLGTGRTSGMASMPRLEEPLIRLQLPDLEIWFSAMVEERWVHLMTVTADVDAPLGVFVSPSNDIQILIGDTDMAITNVRVANSKILTETPMEIEDAIPSLVSLVLPQVLDRLQVPFGIPGAMELGGFEVHVLGVRGVANAGGQYTNLGVYANLGFDVNAVPNLSLAADTVASIESIDVPPSAEQAVAHAGGPVRPTVRIQLGGSAPDGAALEHQLRIDGGLWGPFFTAPSVELSPARFLVQGPHTVEVRARVAGDYRSLDPTPVVLSFAIDSEPPMLSAELAATRAGAYVEAYDVVSQDRLQVEIGVDGAFTAASLDADGFVPIPAVEDPYASITVRAIDEQGLAAEKVLRAGRVRPASVETPSPEVSMCRCVTAPPPSASPLALLALALLLLTRRRRTF